ncbi:hypothetical protein [Mycobacterium sp.]|uniref:hypothetical protein n=1 Tax=Mycobacterium sp. TaxID=1785 RepID=UPI003A88BE86
MELAAVLAAVAAATLVAVVIVGARKRRQAEFAGMLEQRGWMSLRAGETTTVTPRSGGWVVRMTRSYAAQQSTRTHIVTSSWSSPSPKTAVGSALVGPSPPGPLRELAVGLLGSMPDRMAGWLGMDRLDDGKRLRPKDIDDQRLLALATDDMADVGRMLVLASTVEDWCARHPAEREQPVVSISGEGVQVRVRCDVLSSATFLQDFVAFGQRCQALLANAWR